MSIATFFKKPNFGLLIIRLILGTCFIMHGIFKFIGGTTVLEQVGKSLGVFGIHEYSLFFGGLAASAEIIGGILVLLGYQFRLGALLILLVLIVAFSSQFITTHSFLQYGWPLEVGAVFLGLLFIGPGRYSIDRD